jgi:hypothetical protein
MKAKEFLNEIDILGVDSIGVKKPESTSIPRNILNTVRKDNSAESTSAEEPENSEEEDNSVDVRDQDEDELDRIVRLSKGEHRMPAAGKNHTIAQPAGKDVPADPIFVSPLQQELELQKQQGGKESLVIDQIIDSTPLGSTASEQPEQSVYHDSPLKDNEFVGASTGAIDKLRNATTTQGADKPWYKL